MLSVYFAVKCHLYCIIKCNNCNTEVGTFWHMVWACPKIQTYWEDIAGKLSELGGTRVPAEPLVLLLSYLGGRLKGTGIPNFVSPSYCFMLGER